MPNRKMMQKIETLIGICKDSAREANATLSPSAYFNSANRLMKTLQELSQYDSVIRFDKEHSPSVLLKKNLSEQERNTTEFIDRFCDYVENRVKKIPSNEQKLKEALRHVTLMEPFVDGMSTENQDHYEKRMEEIFDEFSY